MRNMIWLFFSLGFYFFADAEQLSENIRLNQVGFYSDGPKMAAVVDEQSDHFFITDAELQDTLYTGELGPAQVWPYSKESVRLADFFDFKQEGAFRLLVPGTGYSYPFTISEHAFQRPGSSALKGYYYQRMSVDLEEQYAGKWKRKMGHPDNEVHIHSSAASDARPGDTVISCPRGWYDAGDYNKYIVNSGISTYQILAAWEHFPDYCNGIHTNIPESGDAVPDILDEALWNIRWMLTMQDPNDGGVYHKCTCANFQGFVMPHRATAKRWVVQKSTAAALDFCAVMAQAARIFTNYHDTFPGLADSCLQAARYAWQWAKAHPKVVYDQNILNQNFDPNVSTGAYGDKDLQDEHDWAAIELFITTKADSFLDDVQILESSSMSVPAWPNVATLGLYSLACHRDNISGAVDTEKLTQRLIDWAGDLRSKISSDAYHVVMGRSSHNFGWGSNAVAANQAMGLLMAFRLSADSTFLWDAIHNMDYLMGRNAVGYCFLTGNGAEPPMNIHHRQSGSDGIKYPVPGLLSGGPNPHQQDKDWVNYPSDLPAKSWIDHQGSWASNEICINWNAPFVYAALGIDAYMSKDGLPEVSVSPKNEKMPQDSRLYPNYPNPFNGCTVIEFVTPESGFVKVDIFNSLGHNVMTLEEGVLPAGRYKLLWHGQDSENNPVASGVYFATLESGINRRDVQKMLYIR